MSRTVCVTAIALALLSTAVSAEDEKQYQGGPTPLTDAATFSPASCFTIASPFSDVTSLDSRCPFVRELFNDGIAGACAAGKFCPDNAVTKGQLAVYLERVMRGASSWDAWTDGPISPSGLDWGSVTSTADIGTMVEYTTGTLNEAAGLYFDGDTAILWSPGDGGLFRIFDQDNGTNGEFFRFSSSTTPTTTLSFYNRQQNGDQTIGFYASPGGVDQEYLRWKNTVGRFEISDSIDLNSGTPGQNLNLTNTSAGSLSQIRGQDGLQIGLDQDNDSTNADLYVYHNTANKTAASTAMELSEDGTLFIRGTLFQSVVFDLAESFLESEPLEAGDVVRVDGRRSDAVRRGVQEDGEAILGVVSTKPGIVLGGTVMDRDSLSEWGADVRVRFETAWPRLRIDLLASSPDLRARLARVSKGTSSQVTASEASPSERALAEAAQDLDVTLEIKALQLFFERNFAAVALSGRVPVKVDASLGAIHVGDPIAASPIPGVAMRATHPGPILGTALEALETGRGKILMFVNRGWWGGTTTTRASDETQKVEKEAQAAVPDAVGARTAETEPVATDGWTLRARGGGQAEMLAVSETVVEGDVLVMDTSDAYRPSTFAEDATVVGVVASRPALLGGRRIDDRSAAVVVAGITTVKVDATWGAIHRGDLLVSSPTRGHAMRADDPPAGTVLGKALESLDSGTGTIRVLMMLR